MTARVAREGRNCVRLAPSRRVAFLVDAEAYFAAVASACEKASDSILIAGWAIDSRVRLRRDGVERDVPDELGPFLSALARRRPGLRIKVLAWDFAMIFGLESGFLPVFRTDAERTRRLQWELDSEHALGAAQHHKLVVVDDEVAFVSGIDLTGGRWDTRAHEPLNPRRADGGQAHGPHHDVGIVVDGTAAEVLGGLLRERWRRATGRKVPFQRARRRIASLHPGTRLGDALDRAGELTERVTERVTERARAQWLRLTRRRQEPERDPWPEGVEPDLTDVSVAVARTEAAYIWHPHVREVEHLWLDAIASARRCIYLENQYFTSNTIAGALARRLAEADGPEVVIILPLSGAGWLEHVTMDVLRDVHLRALQQADAGGRLRIYRPVASDGSPIYVHSKALVVDDELVRIGSSNASNRSFSLDTECDVAVEAEGRPDAAQAIARFRDRLVAEHLGVAPRALTAARETAGSLGGAIESLRGEGRSLRPLQPGTAPWLAALLPTGIADPERTEDVDALAETFVPLGPRPATRAQVARSVALVAVLAALTLGWAVLPLALPDGPRTLADIVLPWSSNPLAPLLAVAAFVALGAVGFPISVLVVASELAFGAWLGSLVSLAGGMASAIFGYIQGRALGRRWLRKLGGSRLNRVSRALASHGVLAVAAARLAPFVPWTLTSLAAGASHVRPLDHLVGTFLGLVPGVLAAALVTDAADQWGLRGAMELALFAGVMLGAWLWARAHVRRSAGGA